MFESGEVLRARGRLQSALGASINQPNPELLYELARTYDPNYVGKLQKADARGNADIALTFYERAATLGSAAAKTDLEQLRKLPPENR